MPFALLGAVALLAVSAWVALAAVALVRRRSAGGSAGLLLSLGALLLAAVETVTAFRFGESSSTVLPGLRALGSALVAGGLWAGAVSPRTGGPPTRQLVSAEPAPTLSMVVVPLAAGVGPAVLSAAAGLAAALAALRARRDAVGGLLAGGLVAVAAAAGLAARAGTPDGALTVVLLRGVGALLLLSALVGLARGSLLGKVVTAILAGVLVASTAAVAVVGTVVADGYDREQATLVAAAADGRQEVLQQTLELAASQAGLAAPACAAQPALCAQSVARVSQQVGLHVFAVRVAPGGPATSVGGDRPLDAAQLVSLAASPAVRQALAGGPDRVGDAGYPTKVRLVGAEPALALVVIIPGGRATPDAAATSAFVYGVRLDDTYVGRDSEAGDFRFSLLVGDDVLASNLSGRERTVIEQIAATARTASGVPAGGLTVAAEGDRPTVHFQPVTALDGTPVGVLALSRGAQAALGAQQSALEALLLTALLVTAAVGGVALLVGRRTVEPVRRLTAAASQVAAGDLTVRTGISGRDEVGTLSRTFDVMTGSVSRLTDDLRAAAARLGAVLASMSDGLLAADGAGLVTSVNRAALAMIDKEEQQVLGRPLAQVLDLRAGGERLGLEPRDRDEAAEVHRADGTTVPVRVALTPLDDGEGVVLVLRDTTREREVERMKTEFLSNVSHELRTPLTPIRGYAEILVGRPGLAADKVTMFATTIRDESIKMNRVVDLLVDVAALEAGRMTVVPRRLPVAELVDARLAAWRTRAPARADDLRRRVAARLPDVYVDPEWVGKALDELLDNAVKYTPPGVSITVVAALSPDGDRVRVGVRDAGAGIAAADQELLFSSFEQVDGSATRRVGGLGLGLSFVRRLAQDAGFPLTVTSAPGKGAEFSLDLPPAEADSVDAPPRRRARRG